MAMSADTDLSAILPDILALGIASFAFEHTKAQTDIVRRLRRDWWPNKNLSGEINPQLLTESQFTVAAAYLVLWKYAVPMLATWDDNDRFYKMIGFYKTRYEEEWGEILRDGIEYDDDQDGVVELSEKQPIHFGRLQR
jgi:hypothetical protein|tara:strand:+ start:813 stop:1226 length:414 start_codon:yes stop_codon:yes gene_type:complete